MAEGIARKYLKEHLISSAGTLPEPVNPNAIKSMEEIGIDISNNQSKKIDSDMLNNFDLVILLKCQKYLQIKRVLKRENMNREKFENINKKFIPERKKIILSDYVINSGIGKNHTMSIIKELIKKHA